MGGNIFEKFLVIHGDSGDFRYFWEVCRLKSRKSFCFLIDFWGVLRLRGDLIFWGLGVGFCFFLILSGLIIDFSVRAFVLGINRLNNLTQVNRLGFLIISWKCRINQG